MGGGDGFGFDDKLLGFVHVFIGEFEYAVTQSRGEQQILAFGRAGHAAQQKPDVLNEAEVEHAIGLVHHHHLHTTQFHRALFDEIDQAPGGRDNDIHAFFELSALLVVIYATVDQCRVELRIPSDLPGVLIDLHREFARRCDDRCARVEAAAVGNRRVIQ